MAISYLCFSSTESQIMFPDIVPEIMNTYIFIFPFLHTY